MILAATYAAAGVAFALGIGIGVFIEIVKRVLR